MVRRRTHWSNYKYHNIKGLPLFERVHSQQKPNLWCQVSQLHSTWILYYHCPWGRRNGCEMSSYALCCGTPTVMQSKGSKGCMEHQIAPSPTHQTCFSSYPGLTITDSVEANYPTS
ncbi:hypothetical protein VNO77_08078 [Canavalia gladiata]|uniref:Uncharacterized protein n=1 Tax=Canavalia gladiata TaxID=3824 RepID=A0AAN9MDT1_CANGL